MLTTAERRTLEKWVRARTTPQRIVLRSRIVPLVGEGVPERNAFTVRNLGAADVLPKGAR